MALFSKQQTYLGIDFDATSIKIVELASDKGRPRLVTYGYYDRQIDKAKDDPLDPDEISAILQMIRKKSRMSSSLAISALPAFSVFSSVLQLPSMDKRELDSAVEWEAKKIVPMPIEDMILDWKQLSVGTPTIGSESTDADQEPTDSFASTLDQVQQRKKTTIANKSKEFTKILLTAAPKDLVKKYITIFKKAGLTLASLDIEAFSLIRSLIGNDKSAIMLVDIGSVVTTITVVADGIPLLNRSIDVGGLTITKAVANSLNVNLARAEQFKYDIGVNAQRAGQGAVPKTIQDALEPIIDEIKFSLNLYGNQGGKKIEKIILTGGSSLLLNLPEYLSERLTLKAYLGDAWARIIYPEELRPVLDELGPRYAVAIGLAMRNIK